MNAPDNCSTTREEFPRRGGAVLLATAAFVLSLFHQGRSSAQSDPQQHSLLGQSQGDVDRKNLGCVSCHTSTDEPSMHPTRTVRLACIDCHGGDTSALLPSGTSADSPQYEQIKKRAH